MKLALNTDSGMLPQSRTIEARMADTAGRPRNASGQTAARTCGRHNADHRIAQHARGERSGKASPEPSREKAQADSQQGSVSSQITNYPKHREAAVLVLDRHGKPLMPTHPARARKLMKVGRARIHKQYPFTIRLIDRILEESAVQPIRLKIDPGSKTTGMCLVREEVKTDGTTIVHHVLFHLELTHRGQKIRKSILQRKGYRRRRRSVNLRYRGPTFDNRTKPEGWLPPSLRSLVDNVMSWKGRLSGLAPVSAATVERVRFDTQAMQNPEISGIEYQQGELAGYEIREYLLEKWGRKCAYCGAVHLPLQVEHIHPKAKGGSNRVSNLTLACQPCNEAKGSMPVGEFLADRPDVLERVLAQAKTPLARRRGGERHAQRHLLRAAGDRIASGVRHWRQDQIQPLSAWHPQGALSGRGLRRTSRPGDRLGHACAVDQSNWTGRISTHQCLRQWLPTRLSDTGEDGAGLPHRGHGSCRCSERQENGPPYRACSGAGQWVVQHPDQARCRPGHQRQALPPAVAGRRLRLRPACLAHPPGGRMTTLAKYSRGLAVRIPPRRERRGLLRRFG